MLQAHRTIPIQRFQFPQDSKNVVGAGVERLNQGVPSCSVLVCSIDGDHEEIGSCFLKALVEFLPVDLEEVAEIEGDAQIGAIGSLDQSDTVLHPVGIGPGMRVECKTDTRFVGVGGELLEFCCHGSISAYGVCGPPPANVEPDDGVPAFCLGDCLVEVGVVSNPVTADLNTCLLYTSPSPRD